MLYTLCYNKVFVITMEFLCLLHPSSLWEAERIDHSKCQASQRILEGNQKKFYQADTTSVLDNYCER